LYKGMYELWTVTLRETHRQREFEKRATKERGGFRRENVTRDRKSA